MTVNRKKLRYGSTVAIYRRELCRSSIFPADPDFLPVTFITAHFINKMSSRRPSPNLNMRAEKDLSRRQPDFFFSSPISRKVF